MAIATKRRELELSEEVKEFYSQCWNTANERLQKLGMNITFLQKIRDPYEFNKLLEQDFVGELKGIGEAQKRLNSIFANKNNLPEKILDTGDLIRLFEYIEENMGMASKIAGWRGVDIKESNSWSEYRSAYLGFDPGEFWFEKGSGSLRSIGALIHEMDHLKRKNPAFSIGPDMVGPRRAHFRYSDGKAMFAWVDLVKSNDDALKAYYALEFLQYISMPTPQFYANHNLKFPASFARRYGEGFRDYYTLQARVGRERVAKFEETCLKKDLIPGIDKEGKLVAVDTDKLKLYDVNVDKLKAGVIDIEGLERKHRFPHLFG